MYPTENITVTFELSCAAAKQLRELAVSKDIRLRDIGILKVKISDGREISLIDQDNFKKPTLPVFSRKEQKNRVLASSSGRGSRCVNKDNGNRSYLVQGNVASITYQLQTLPLTDNSNRLIDIVNHDGQNCLNSHPLILNPEKKRVVLISQGTATEEAKQSLNLNSPSNENFPPTNVANSTQMEVDTEGSVCSSDSEAISETFNSPYSRSQLRETSAGSQEHNLATKHFSESRNHLTDEPPDKHVRSLSRVPPNRVFDSCSTSLNSSDNHSVLIGDLEVSSYTNGRPQQAKLAPSVSEIYYATNTSESSISTRNFQALQMLSDICVYETNMVSHEPSHPAIKDDKNVSVGCQTNIKEDSILSQNISIEFVDENELASGIVLMARYPKCISSKSKHNQKRGTASVIQDNAVGNEAVDDEECGCATGNYYLCSKLRRRSRYRWHSSTSSHSMCLRSRDEQTECGHQGIATTYYEGMDSIEQKPTDDGTRISSDYNNNAVLYTTNVENTRSANAHGTICKSKIRFVPDEMSFSPFMSLASLNSSPLAMLKGTVNRIPSPDAPRSQRDKHSPKNIVSEYTEIIGLRSEEQASVTKHPSICKPDHLSFEDSLLDDFDVMTAPPPLLYKEQGTMKLMQFQKTSFLDTPPPLNESAVTALTCLSSRRNLSPSTAEPLEPVSSPPNQYFLPTVAICDLSSGCCDTADTSCTTENKNTTVLDSPLILERSLATSEQDNKDIVSSKENSIGMEDALTSLPTGVGTSFILEQTLADSSTDCKIEKSECDQEGAADGPRISCSDTQDGSQDDKEQRFVKDPQGVSALSIVLDVIEEVIETVTCQVHHSQINFVGVGNGKGNKWPLDPVRYPLVELSNQDNSTNSEESVTCYATSDNSSHSDPPCKVVDSTDKLPSSEEKRCQDRLSFVDLDSSVNKTETTQGRLDGLPQVPSVDYTTHLQESDTKSLSEDNSVDEEAEKLVDVAKTSMNLDGKSPKVEDSSNDCIVNCSINDSFEKLCEGEDRESKDKNVAEDSLKSIAQKDTATKTMHCSKKGQHRKRLPDGTIVDDLSYVLKRIQGDDNSKGGRKNMSLVTRRQKRCLESQPRTFKRTRYSR